MRQLFITCVCIFMLIPLASGITYFVKPDGTGDFETIQLAVDASTPGDIIMLANGVFSGLGNRDIDCLGKAITIQSQSGDPDSCILDCENAGRAFYCHSGEDLVTRFEGVTITNGSVEGEYPLNCGAGILCYGCPGPSIVNCMLISNHATFYSSFAPEGGGIYCYGSSPTLTDCSFVGNSARAGGGASCKQSTPHFDRCTFIENGSISGGGGLYAWHADLGMTNTTFYGNWSDEAQYGGAICLGEGANATLANCIIAFSPSGAAIYRVPTNPIPSLNCCDLFGNAGGDWVGGIQGQLGIDGNISEDPLFCDPESGYFNLQSASPCVPFSPPNEECDLIGAWPVGCEQNIYVVNPEGTGDFPTIQAAIDAAVDGDIVQLTDGTFTGEGNRDIDYLGKEITVRSQPGHLEQPLIACGFAARGFIFVSGEGPGSILEGITIANGYKDGPGAGIYCLESSPTISDCRIIDCYSTGWAGGIYLRGSESTVSECIFRGCHAETDGGAMRIHDSSPTLIQCTFDSNCAAYGGGLYLVGSGVGRPTISNCTFFSNEAQNGGAGVFDNATCRVQNVVIANSIGGEAYYSPDGTELTCCDFYGNEGGDWVGDIAGQLGITGNISEDPLFCNPGSGNFYLAEDSPCAPFSPPNAGCDLIGAWPVGCGMMAIQEERDLAMGIMLGQSNPNPFTSTTRMAYSIPGTSPTTVHLAIYDTGGRLIRTLADASRVPGAHSVSWDGTSDEGSRIAAGAYFYRLTVGGESVTRQLLMVR